MLPALSITIPSGPKPVDPRIVDIPSGVIFETLSAPESGHVSFPVNIFGQSCPRELAV